MNLSAFSGRYVLVQFKQPYTLVLPFAAGEKPMPMIVKVQAPGEEKAKELPIQVPFVMGKVKIVEADYGDHMAMVQFMDANNQKMEVVVAEDMIFSVSAVSQDTIITP